MADGRVLRGWWWPLVGALMGGLFFAWIAGARTINPAEVAWTMKLDWRIHFLGWHLFRSEPWHWPPGLLEGFQRRVGCKWHQSRPLCYTRRFVPE